MYLCCLKLPPATASNCQSQVKQVSGLVGWLGFILFYVLFWIELSPIPRNRSEIVGLVFGCTLRVEKRN